MDSAADPRTFIVSVAGPAALIVAKLHKINDRISNPTRLDNKDAAGSRMAGAAEEIVGDPVAVSESVGLLTQDLLSALDDSVTVS